MDVRPFAVEQWMNAHETAAVHNIAETCADSLTLQELLELSGDAERLLGDLRRLKLTYGDIPGSLELRSGIAALYEGAALHPDQVVVTNGAIGANFLVHYALLRPGDRVICVQPTYQQLSAVPESFGAEVVPLPLRPENQWLPDLDELRRLLAEPTAMVVLNNPDNPTGSLMPRSMLEAIVALVEPTGAWLHCDEVYRGLEHHDDVESPSVLELYARAVSTGSMSKVWSLAGLRTGWVAGPPEVIQACLLRRDYTTISVGMLDDRLSAVALQARDRLIARNLDLVRGNVAMLGAWVEREPRLSWVPPRAGTTAFVRYESPIPSEEFCQGLFDHSGTFVVPGAAFGWEGWFRVGYACAPDVLRAGLAAFSDYLATLE